MCTSRKNPHPPQGRSLKISRGRWVLRAKRLEAKYEAKKFPGGGEGAEQTTFHGGGGGGGMDILGTAQY